MHAISTSLLSITCLLTLTSAVPFSFANNPLNNNFPTPNAEQQQALFAQAHGSLPNTPSPSSVNPNTVTSLQLIAFNEIFEVAFFTELIQNITNNVEGYEILNTSQRDQALTGLLAILAQEEVVSTSEVLAMNIQLTHFKHTLFANSTLNALGAQTVQPCAYNFPSTTLTEAYALASAFTDIVLGTLPNIQELLANARDSSLIPGIGSVIGQEGEQNGVYRFLQNKIPSALPFLTAGTREFAFSALNQMFVVPGSCEIDYINLPVYEPLTVVTSPVAPQAQEISFAFPMPTGNSTPSWNDYKVVYVNQQNLPIVENLQAVEVSGGMVEFTAAFPYNGTTFGNGLTYVLVTEGSTANLMSAGDVAKITKYGPGLISVN